MHAHALTTVQIGLTGRHARAHVRMLTRPAGARGEVEGNVVRLESDVAGLTWRGVQLVRRLRNGKELKLKGFKKKPG